MLARCSPATAAGACVAKADGIKVTPHHLRHTFCHELVEWGKVPADRVALLAGHAVASGRTCAETTVRSTTASQAEMEWAIEVIEWE